MQLLTECIPLLLFSDPKAVPSVSPWSLCENGNLGSMEANVMAGRALFGRFQLPEGPHRCAIFLVQEKVMQGTSRSADSRAYRRIAPKSLELVLVSSLFFFRPTPSWLPPGRSTCLRACCSWD